MPDSMKDENVPSEDPDLLEIKQADKLLAQAQRLLLQQTKKSGTVVSAIKPSDDDGLLDQHIPVQVTKSSSSEMEKTLGTISVPQCSQTKSYRPSQPYTRNKHQNVSSVIISKNQVDKVKKVNLSSPTVPQYKPAHVRAPFLTRQESAPKSGIKTAAKPAYVRRRQGMGISNHGPLLDGSSCKSVRNNGSVEQKQTAETLGTSNDSHNTDMVQETPANATRHHVHSELLPTDCKIESHSNFCSDMTRLQIEEDKCQTCTNEITTTFNLLKDGSKMNIPSKFKKLSVMNKKLQHKLQISSLAHQESFNWERSFFAKFEVALVSERNNHHDYMSQIVQHTHSCLEILTKLDSLASSLPDEKCSWQEVLKAKSMLEHILFKFAHLEDAYHRLNSGLSLSQIQNKKLTVSPREPLSNSLWLPTYLLSGKLISPRPIKYDEKSHLLYYTELLHRVQLLMLDLYLLDVVEKELMPSFAKQQDNRLPLEIFRGIYSMLCSGGCSFPVFVADCVDF